MDLFNYKDNCRLCLKTHTDFMKNIFTHYIEGCRDTLVENIFALFRVELSPHEDYPQFICRKCLTELENILLFKEDLQRNQDFLLDLFKATYPTYVEKKKNFLKNVHTPNSSIDSGVELKSIAVNTDTFIDFTTLDDPEYVRVPVNFLKQFSPQVNIQINELPELKEEIIDDTQELAVNICKYCRKQFTSDILLHIHCKKCHESDEQRKKIKTRKRVSKGTKKTLTRKIKTDENRNVSISNLSEFAPEQLTSPEIDLEASSNTGVKAKLCGPGFQENQAVFLQNFNLIAKEEAALIKTKQESPKTLPKRHSFKKQIVPKKIKKTVVKQLKTKNIKSKAIVKPFSARSKRSKTENNSQEIIFRSVQFLKRYGWRKLNSSSRRGTILNTDKKFNLFQSTNLTTKSFSKKENFTKSGKKNTTIKSKLECKDKSKTVQKDEGCEHIHNFVNSDLAGVSFLPGVQIKRSNSIGSSELQKIAGFNANQNSATSTPTSKSSKIVEVKQDLKESPKTSISSNKNNLNNVSDVHVENALLSKFESVVKSETPPASPKEEDGKSEKYKAIPSTSFYDNSKNCSPTTSVFGIRRRSRRKATLCDSQTCNKWLMDPILKNPDLCKSLKQNLNGDETELPHLSNSQKNLSENHGRSRTSLSFYDPQHKRNEIGLKLKLFRSGSTSSNANHDFKSEKEVWSCRNSLKRSVLDNTDNAEEEKQLRVQLNRHESSKKGDGSFSESSVDIKLEHVSNMDTLIKRDELFKRRGRPKRMPSNTSLRTTDLASASGTESIRSLSPKRRSCPIKKQNSENKESSNRNTTTVANPILKINNTSNYSLLPDGESKTVTNKRGRPKKNQILRSSSSSSVTTNSASSNFAGLDDQESSTHYSVLNNKPSLLDVSLKDLNFIPPSSYTNDLKKEDLSLLQDLNDRYEINENIGLRIKLRKRVSCESLNSLKYDTQEFDENILPEYIMGTNINTDFKDVPDNKQIFISHDKKVNVDSVSNINIKDEGTAPEKVVNIDLEDEEIQMLVLISDNEDIDFDNDDISKYVKSKNNSLNLEQDISLSRPKICLPSKKNDLYLLDDDLTEKNYRSQTSLPLNKHKFKKVNSDQNKTSFSNRLRSRSSVDLESGNTTPVKRRGRPPTKFSPSTYATNRSKSTAELLRNTFNNRNIELTREKHFQARSRSSRQTHVHTSENRLVNEVKKRGRPSRTEESKTTSTLRERSSSPNKPHSSLQQRSLFGSTSRQNIPKSVEFKKRNLDPSAQNLSEFAKNGSLVKKKVFSSRAVHDNNLNTQSRK